MKVLIILMIFFPVVSFAGISPSAKLKTYKIYSFDSQKVILQSKSKKWVINRKVWGSSKPTIGHRWSLSKGFVKKLKPYRK